MKGKQRSLNGLFWRYLLSTMALLAGVLLALWFVLLQLIRMGAVLPADTGARNLERTTVLLQAQETFDPGEIPFYYRWALADSQCCAVPTSIFSNHTAYEDYYFTDYTSNMEAYIEQWKKLDLKFEGICTGFLGSAEQIRIVSEFIH